MNKNNQQVTVDFPQQTNWIGGISEMEVLPPHHQEIACSNCFMRPIVGPRFKCRVCENFNYCENCFYAPFDHQHNFVRIAEPGVHDFTRIPPRLSIEITKIYVLRRQCSHICWQTAENWKKWIIYVLRVGYNRGQCFVYKIFDYFVARKLGSSFTGRTFQ